jgi:hypothetical protein
LTLHYIIAVQTHDPNGNPYEGHPEDRARETFNLTLGRGVDDPVNLTKIEEEDLPKEKLEQVLLRHDEAVYLVKNESGLIVAEPPSEPTKPSFPPVQLRGTVFDANSPRVILYHRSDPKYVRHLRPIRSHRQRDA